MGTYYKPDYYSVNSDYIHQSDGDYSDKTRFRVYIFTTYREHLSFVLLGWVKALFKLKEKKLPERKKIFIKKKLLVKEHMRDLKMMRLFWELRQSTLGEEQSDQSKKPFEMQQVFTST